MNHIIKTLLYKTNKVVTVSINICIRIFGLTHFLFILNLIKKEKKTPTMGQRQGHKAMSITLHELYTFYFFH